MSSGAQVPSGSEMQPKKPVTYGATTPASLPDSGAKPAYVAGGNPQMPPNWATPKSLTQSTYAAGYQAAPNWDVLKNGQITQRPYVGSSQAVAPPSWGAPKNVTLSYRVIPSAFSNQTSPNLANPITYPAKPGAAPALSSILHGSSYNAKPVYPAASGVNPANAGVYPANPAVYPTLSGFPPYYTPLLPAGVPAKYAPSVVETADCPKQDCVVSPKTESVASTAKQVCVVPAKPSDNAVPNARQKKRKYFCC